MAIVSIIMICGFLIFFILSQKVKILIIQQDKLIIEIHLVILAVQFTKNESKSGKGERKTRLEKDEKRKVFSVILNHIRKSEIIIEELSLPIIKYGKDDESLIGRSGYNIIISTLLAYLHSTAERVTITDGAIKISEKTEKLNYKLCIESRLYQLIYALSTLLFGIIKGKRNRKYVRE